MLGAGQPRGEVDAGALRHAPNRLRPYTGRIGQPDAAFGSLGEVLFWLCALDQLLIDIQGPSDEVARNADPDGRRVPGLRFARNQVRHGVQVVSLSQINPTNAVLGPAVLGRMRLGTPANLTWRPRAELPPPHHQRQGQEAAYDQHLVGQAVVDTIDGAVSWLSVTAEV